MAKYEGSRSRSRDHDSKKSRNRDDDHHHRKKDNHWKGKRKHYKKHEDNDSDDGSRRKQKHVKGKRKNRKYEDSDSSSSDSDSDDDSRRNKRKDNKKNKNNKKKSKKSNDNDSGDGSNDDCDWNIGWVGRNNNDGNDTKNGDDDNDGNSKDNGDHCCLWKEISQNPFLRQVNAELSQYLADNKKTFWTDSSPSSLDVTMVDAVQLQSNSAWQNKVNNTPGAIMLLSTRMGKFIAQALHGYFDPWMDLPVLNETYMLVQKDASAPNSQGVGAYTVHSRRPIFPHGPTDLCVKVENGPAAVMMVVSPCDTAEFYCRTGVGGGMNFYRKDIQNPIEGFQVVVELDNSYNGVCLSLAMANLERAWNYVYSSFIKLPQ